MLCQYSFWGKHVCSVPFGFGLICIKLKTTGTTQVLLCWSTGELKGLVNARLAMMDGKKGLKKKLHMLAKKVKDKGIATDDLDDTAQIVKNAGTVISNLKKVLADITPAKREKLQEISTLVMSESKTLFEEPLLIRFHRIMIYPINKLFVF